MCIMLSAGHQGRAETMTAKYQAAVPRVLCMALLGHAYRTPSGYGSRYSHCCVHAHCPFALSALQENGALPCTPAYLPVPPVILCKPSKLLFGGMEPVQSVKILSPSPSLQKH